MALNSLRCREVSLRNCSLTLLKGSQAHYISPATVLKPKHNQYIL